MESRIKMFAADLLSISSDIWI